MPKIIKNSVFWYVTMLQCVALIRTDVSEECSVSVIWVTGISKLGITLRASVASYC
jgi:hypothetical protein